MLSYNKSLKHMTIAGLTVLRFSDREVLGQIDAVLEKIWSRL